LLQSTSSAHARFAPYSTPSLNTHAHLTALCPVPESKTNLDFTEARNSEWQWHQSGCMQVCTSLQTDNHASTPPLSFLQAGCPSCRQTNSVKALKKKHPKLKMHVFSTGPSV